MKIETTPKKLNIKFQTTKVYPALEDLEITPSSQEQNFKSKKYGYGNIKVKAIESEELNIIPSTEEQIKEGLFNKVTINKVTNEIDNNIIADNIKEGITILGTTGTFVGEKYAPKYISFSRCPKTNLDYETRNLDTSNVTDMSYMFSNCSSLTSLDLSNFDTSNVTNMYNMFDHCSELTSLNLSSFDTSNVTNIQRMFSYCSELTSLNLSSFDTSNVITLYDMFGYCSSLTSLDLSNFDTSKVTYMNYMFSCCSELTSLNLSSFDTSNVINVVSIFEGSRKLTNLKSFKNLGKGYTQKSNNYSNYNLDLSQCPLLTHESLMSVINNLYDLNLTYDTANGGTLYRQSLKLGSTNLAKLTAEEIAIAENKGWNVI